MRRLMIQRIVHGPQDMGSMKDGLEKEGVSKMGRQRWEESQKKIERFWNEVEAEVDALGLDPSKLRIYQDGLPCAGAIGEKIIKETAEKGSRNYQIIKKLMDRGARIEATESPDLLRREYACIKAFIEAGTDEERARAGAEYERIKDKLMEERDSFIAQSINSTLQEGETGLLFIGASHNVMPRIARDVEVKCLG